MTVLNFYKIGKTIPDGAVYIGRTNSKFGLEESKYHNPFKVDDSVGDTREVVVEKFRKYLHQEIKNGNITEKEVIDLTEKDLVCYCAPKSCHGDVLVRAGQYFRNLAKDRKIIYDRFAGYQVNTKGDRRYSPFITRIRDGRTIEEIYQCDVKGYDVGGTNWKLGKGKPSLDKDVDLFTSYFELWEEWFNEHPKEVDELHEILKLNLYRIGDKFGTTSVNQGLVLSILLNEKYYGYKRLLIAGSRDIKLTDSDFEDIRNTHPKISLIVSGGARGVDKEGITFADKYGIEKLIYKAKWDTANGFDAGAGMKRNAVLIDRSHSAIFYWDGVSPGTKNAIDRYKKTGKPYIVKERMAVT